MFIDNNLAYSYKYDVQQEISIEPVKQQQVYTTRYSYMQIELYGLVQNANSQSMNEGGNACSLINTKLF